MPRFVVGSLVACACLLGTPAAALADDFPVIPSDPVSLQAALDAAEAHAGPDRVIIPAGTYALTGTSSFAYQPASPSDNGVEILGAGRSSTLLTKAGTTGTTLTVNGPNSVVRALTVENDNTDPNDPKVALDLLSQAGGSTVEDVELRGPTAGGFAFRGHANVTIQRSRVVVRGPGTGLRQNVGALTVIDTSVEALATSSGSGVNASSGASADVARVRSVGMSTAFSATFGGATLTVRDSLVVLPATSGGTALAAGDNNNPSDHTATVAADRLTVVGATGQNHRGARVNPNSAGDSFQVNVRDSLFIDVATPLDCSAAMGGSGAVSADWSSLPATGDISSAGCPVTRSNPVLGTAVFADADYRPRFDSPLVDAGNPDVLALTFDLDGLTRPVGRRDVGAYEYQRRPPVVTASAAPAVVAPGQPVSFQAAGSDPDPGEAVTFTWAFDDGTSASGSTVSHAFGSAGSHSATLTATDPAGVTATATATVTVIAPPATAQPGTASPDQAPQLSRVGVVPRRFGRRPFLPRLLSGSATDPPTRRRPEIRFTLTEAATVTVTFERRVGPRFRRVRGRVRVRAPQGSSRLRFGGRISRKRSLRPGRHRAVLLAADAAGNRSLPARAALTLLR